MSDEYVRRNETVLAMQLKEDNLDNILDWLRHLDIQYSYDEITSAGELIVYDPSDGPAIVGLGWWIVINAFDLDTPNKQVYVFNNHVFSQRFERRTV